MSPWLVKGVPGLAEAEGVLRVCLFVIGYLTFSHPNHNIVSLTRPETLRAFLIILWAPCLESQEARHLPPHHLDFC